MTAAPITALVAMNPFFLPLQNSIPAPVGQAFTNQPTRNLSPLKKTPLFLCVESRLYVANAMPTSVMCSKTGRNLLALGIALIPLPSILKNLKRPSLPSLLFLFRNKDFCRWVKRIPGKPKPYHRRQLVIFSIPYNCRFSFSIKMNLYWDFVKNIFYWRTGPTQL